MSHSDDEQRPNPPARSKITQVLELVQIIAIIVTGTWVAGVWLHTNVTLPSRQSQFLVIEPRSKILGQEPDRNMLLVSVEVENTSSRTIHNVVHVVAIYGIKYMPPNLDSVNSDSVNSAVTKLSTIPASPPDMEHFRITHSRRWTETSAELLAVSSLAAPATFFAPKSRQIYERLFALENDFDAYNIEVAFYHANCALPRTEARTCPQEGLLHTLGLAAPNEETQEVFPDGKPIKLHVSGDNRIVVEDDHNAGPGIFRSRANTVVYAKPLGPKTQYHSPIGAITPHESSAPP